MNHRTKSILESLVDSPFTSKSWTPSYEFLDTVTPAPFKQDDIVDIFAYGVCRNEWDGREVVVAGLADQRVVGWETTWETSGSGFHAGVWGGDATIFVGATVDSVVSRLSEATRELIPIVDPRRSNSHYYILNLQFYRGEGFREELPLLWWKPNNKGYTPRLAEAGVYTRETVEEMPAYYNNQTRTIAIRCADAWPVLRKHGVLSENDVDKLVDKPLYRTQTGLSFTPDPPDPPDPVHEDEDEDEGY